MTAAPGHELVDLTWDANTEATLAGYRVYRDGVMVAEVLEPETTWRNEGLVNGVTYQFAVSAFNKRGDESALSTPVSAMPVDQVPPTVPTGLAGGAERLQSGNRVMDRQHGT